MDSDKRVPIQTADGRVFDPVSGQIGEYSLRNRLESARARFSRWNGRLIESLREARAECEESAAVIDRLAQILAGVAVSLKGEELPLHRHGYHDLVEGVSILKLEAELLKAENEVLRKDAERYRWLRDSQEDYEIICHHKEELDKIVDQSILNLW